MNLMNEKRGKLAFDLYEKVKKNERVRRLLLAENAQFLSEILENKYYKEILGDEEGEWAGFLADIELYYTRNQVNTYARLYKRLTSELGISPEIWVDVPVTRLSDCLPILTTKNYGDWFASALSLTAQDWNKELYKHKHGHELEDEEKHTHDMVNYDICRVCGIRKKCHGKH